MNTKIVTSAFSILFFYGGFVAQAQEATTTINLILSDVLSIDPGSAASGGEIDFHYISVDDYHSQKTATIPNSLIITVSKPFDIKVRANGESFESGSNVIPVDVLTVQRNQHSSVSGISKTIVLSSADQVLISNAPLGSSLTLDLDYIIPASRSSSPNILGKPAGTYTQTVTYTVTTL